MGLGIITAFLLLQSAPAAQTIDRLVAVVGGEPIFQSDVREVVRLRLLDPGGMLAPVAEDPAAPEESRALERMINRRLVLAEVARYSQAPPPAAEIEAAVHAWNTRSGSNMPLQTSAGVEPAVVGFVADTLRIERYIDQRFTAAAQPTRDEARAFYQANPALFARGGVTLPFESVEDEARRRLAEERRVAMVREWLRGLRERAAVRILR